MIRWWVARKVEQHRLRSERLAAEASMMQNPELKRRLLRMARRAPWWVRVANLYIDLACKFRRRAGGCAIHLIGKVLGQDWPLLEPTCPPHAIVDLNAHGGRRLCLWCGRTWEGSNERTDT